MSTDVDDDRAVVGVELGGTKAIVILAHGATIVDRYRVPTSAPEPTLRAVTDRIAEWIDAGTRPQAIGIGSFGPVGLDPGREDYGHITATPKPGWSGTDVVGRFGRFGVPVAFEHDVAAAALAEGRWGAAQGCTDHVYITIGTGIGVGIVAAGRPVHGMIHPEAGHLRVRRRPGDRFAGVCPFHGDCIEGLASGPAIAARAGVPADQLDDDHPVWRDVIAELGELIAALALTVSPQRIVLGGGVGAGRIGLVDGIRHAVTSVLGGYLVGLDEVGVADLVRPAALGADAGPMGTVAVAHTSRAFTPTTSSAPVAATSQPCESG